MMTPSSSVYIPFLLCFLFLGLLGGSRPAMAIVNVEDMMINEPEPGVSGQVDASVNGTSGNSNTVQASGGARVQWQHGAYTDIGMVNYAYGKSQGRSNVNQGFAHLRHRLHLSRQWGVEVFLQAQKNDFTRLLFRGLAGGGLRWRIGGKSQRVAVYTGAGAMYAVERYKAQAGTNDARSTNTIRGNFYLVLKYRLNDHVRFLSTTYYQPRFSYPADFRMLEDAAMNVNLIKSLDFRTTLQVQHNNRPPQGIKRTNLIYASGIEYHF